MAGLDLDEWITSSNECFEINLIRPTSDPADCDPIFSESFQPTFTYPIINEKEILVGYKDPRIELNFRANDLKPSLKVQFEEKIDLSTILGDDDPQVDLENVWKDFLPESVFDPSQAPSQPPSRNDPLSKSWKPPGKLIKSFSLSGKQFEVWGANMSDPAAHHIWDNMKILTLLYIEGATYPDLDAQWSLERWTLFLLYEVTPIEEDVSPYTLAGFSTSYRYWIYPTFDVMRATNSLPSPPTSSNGESPQFTGLQFARENGECLFNDKLDLLESPSRERISQFLILPPYQGQSLGANLYDTILAHLVEKPFIYEVPVEDPSEDFDAMRDFSDIVYLRNMPEFASLALPATLPPETLRKSAPVPRDLILGNGRDLDELRQKSKIVPRQFNRMVELHHFCSIPINHRSKARITRKDKASNENDRKYYFWRLALKDRIYRQNADQLEQLEDAAERVEKLEMAVDSQQQEYEEREEGIERRKKWSRGEQQPEERRKPKGKRKRVVVDEDEDEDDGWEDMDEDAGASKRPKL
ncbi:acyl-CoA N-acyltransferase [Periconia macrospinosa]|uniref:Histone acetyltransferase type B catalytic subunit n=1 Tax=Periconia macrospinosa TaxID=97972 RepID=A0A2V1EAS1_9PLEO|nr:acyl-CoA N-acyltransferase [Periconia macrospinosa]